MKRNDIKLDIAIHNRFDFVARDAKTGEIVGEYKAENIILNGFWTKLLSTGNADCYKYIHFGTGVDTPVATDVKLGTWLGYKTAPVFNASGTIYDFTHMYDTGIITMKKSVRLQDTEYNGNSISEVGYSSTTSSTTGLLTKALIKDQNGNVVAIEKTSAIVLDIYATVFFSIGTSGFNSGKIIPLLQDPNLNFSLLACLTGCNSWPTLSSGYWGNSRHSKYAKNTNFSIDMDGVSTIANGTVSYNTTNKTVTFTLSNVVAASGNQSGGLRALYCNGLLVHLPCSGFAQPVLTKEVIGTGDGNTKDFKAAFGYILNNGTAKVYVNDVEQSSGVTIDYGRPYPRYDISGDMNVLSTWGSGFTKTGTGPYGIVPSEGVCLESGSLGSEHYGSAGMVLITFENPFYETIPITHVTVGRTKVYASNDLTNWYECASNTSTALEVAVNATYQGYRYFQYRTSGTSQPAMGAVSSTVNLAAKNVHFDSAPANGATIALTYQPDCIAKDANHVLNNISITMTFAEYTP